MMLHNSILELGTALSGAVRTKVKQLSQETEISIRLVCQVAAIVFSVELAIMFVLPIIAPDLGGISEGLVDATLLTLLTTPILYHAIVDPFVRMARTSQDRMVQELSENHRQTDRLSATLAKLDMHKRILDQHAIVFETDCNGTIVYANQAYCRISGYSEDELIGKSHQAISGDFHSAEFWADLYAKLRQGEVWQGELCSRAKDGGLYWVQATKSAVFDNHGEVVGYASVRTDITEAKLRQQNLEKTQSLLLEATAKSEAANIAKSEFLATMSHEIRTPMNGVMGMLGLLSDAKLQPEEHRLVRAARESADNLLVLINDILDYSKLEAGKIQLEDISFSPVQVVDNVISILSSRADAKGLSLTLDIVPDIPQWILGDPTRLRQILFNLVGNAIKFTERGEIRIIASHRSLAGGSTELYFEVRDTGIGIPKEARARLFSRFSQADGSTTRKFGGTGLGLAISKQLTNMMGGEIGVESQPGVGSRFWFTIQCSVSEPPKEVELESAGDYDDLLARKLRILVADDNHVNQMFICALLEKRGHSVDVVANGLEAVEALMRVHYDVVLMDVQMPEMDGPTATRHIRRLDNPLSRIPIIALTANAMSGQREEYLAAGMDDYVSKPIDPVKLFGAIVRICQSRILPPALTGAAASDVETSDNRSNSVIEANTNAEDSEVALIDYCRIAELRKYIDRDQLKIALGALHAEAEECTAQLQEAISSHNLQAARIAAHRLRGMASNVGAARLMEIASDFELKAHDTEAIELRLEELHSTIRKTTAVLSGVA